MRQSWSASIERFVEQAVFFFLPQIRKGFLEAFQLVPQELIHERIVDQMLVSLVVLVVQERIHEHIVEPLVIHAVPQIEECVVVEDRVEMDQILSQECISKRNVKQCVDAPTPERLEQIVGVPMPQVMEEIVSVAVPQIWEESVEPIRPGPLESRCHRIVEQSVLSLIFEEIAQEMARFVDVLTPQIQKEITICW